MKKQSFLIVLGFVVASMGLLGGCNGSGNKPLSESENGFKYIHHIQNEGPKPQVGEYAYFHIEVLLDDTLLQSSRKNNDTPLAQIPTAEQAKLQPNPVTDVLPLMSVGDSLTIIQDLDSLPQRPPEFEKYKTLYYNISLVEIKSEEDYKVIAEEQQKIQKEKALVVQARLSEVTEFTKQVLSDYNSGKLNSKLSETASGLKYIIHEEGTGEVPKAGDIIKVHYFGMLPDGTEFDNSFKRGEPHIFPVGQGQVIPGWDEGLMLFKRGTKATLFIPYQLAYGEAGRPPAIPAKSELVFYVELLDLTKE
jgi:FKBP-type peptidyl-prolyl cis-trans isomerase FkpA